MKQVNRIVVIAVLTTLSLCGVSAAEKSAEAQQLMQLLNSINGKKTLSGTMACVNWNISEAQWVHNHTGKWPAIAAFDLIHLPFSSKGGWIDYDNISVVEDWHNQGGLVTIGWHWNVPARSGKSGKYAFYWGTDKGKEDEQTTFDVKKIFEPASAEYQRMINDIDRVADILLKLKQRGIPVLWRPLHEAGGMWFWWGRDPEGCNELWRTMYRRFQKKGVDNLIWVWTQGAAWNKPYSDGYRWYPGDDYVDIVGIDIYNETNATTIRTQCYDFLKQSSPTKLAALTECGSVAHIGQQWTAGARWLYFVPWYDYDVSNDTSSAAFKGTAHANADVAWWNEAFSHDYVMTRDDVKELAATAVHSPVAPVHVNANPSFFHSSLFPLYIKNGKKYIKKTNTSK